MSCLSSAWQVTFVQCLMNLHQGHHAEVVLDERQTPADGRRSQPSDKTIIFFDR